MLALIGRERFDVLWKDLERQVWIASATCVEETVPMSAEPRMEYALADRRAQFRIAAENPTKMVRLHRLLGQHRRGTAVRATADQRSFCIVLHKVGNFAIDLADTDVLVQVLFIVPGGLFLRL